jgi:hypothetical protein
MFEIHVQEILFFSDNRGLVKIAQKKWRSAFGIIFYFILHLIVIINVEYIVKNKTGMADIQMLLIQYMFENTVHMNEILFLLVIESEV